MKRVGSLAALSFVLLAAHAQEGPARRGEPEKLDDYAIYRRNPLTQKQNGIDGELQLLQDARLSAALRSRTWGQVPLEVLVFEDPASPFKKVPARNAVLRIVDRGGRVVDRKPFDKPLAKMEAANLYGDDRIAYLVSVDYSSGMGSYNGPVTSLVEVARGKLKWLEAVDKATGKPETINVVSSLKTAWRITDAPRGTARDILQVACRPDFASLNEVSFLLIYTRYSFDGKNWVKLERQEKGFAELDDLRHLLDRKPFP